MQAAQPCAGATTADGDAVFELGNITYLANLQNPTGALSCDGCTSAESLVPFTVIEARDNRITGAILEATLNAYRAEDDVFSDDFLGGLYLASSDPFPVLDISAVEYLANKSVGLLLLDSAFSTNYHNISGSITVTSVTPLEGKRLSSGPYAASISANRIAFSSVYRLYRDEYRDFLFGSYNTNDGHGTHNPLGMFLPKFWDPLIPIYAWGDTRPLAGQRVAVKDLFDIRGLQTSAGSQAWATITPVANGTAPSIQRIIDLGAVIVGKYKLAQFASGADPWEWQDEHYPWNPRGDGYLTCSASSSGGGCSIAAYDWLDFAIGSDTGSSMRRPAAVSGIYGNRPSQGMMNLDRVVPLGDATDTAGVFCRDPRKWVKFAKAWYSPGLHQNTSITGLPKLVVPDTRNWPKRILYPVEYFPLANPAAELILQDFLGNMSKIFDMKIEKINFNSIYQAGVDAADLTQVMNIINSYHQYQVVAKPLMTAWKRLFSGRFPPIDPQWRLSWRAFNETTTDASVHAYSLQKRAEAVAWSEQNLLYSTNESCSESIMILDIGTGGLPSFREEDLMTENPAASFLGVTPSDAVINEAAICPTLACADYTIPIGQVSYFSNVTFHTEYMPVTVNLAVKRGCDFMLFNMIDKLAQEGVLKTVHTGRTAY
ncbi:hypothetical protein BP6252_10704 [Coleophoma cylindrospora]|uniref:Uncharacterized protein n=1 Tax=Coleophoma cylindrospora TaxID=1849047 RepID=A0A3D8QTA1_9HELO|nr:hypothetical protein BP6252_10704 [Coleophoma cylindrospora]